MTELMQYLVKQRKITIITRSRLFNFNVTDFVTGKSVSSVATLGGKSWMLGDIWRARSASLLFGSGAEPQRGPGAEPWWGVRGRSPPPPEAESLVACGSPMETANCLFSLFCKLDTHRPTMHIWCVSKNNYGDVWSSINVKCTVLSQSTKSIW